MEPTLPYSNIPVPAAAVCLCMTILLTYLLLCVSLRYLSLPLNDHLCKTTTLEIRPLWFSPKSLNT